MIRRELNAATGEITEIEIEQAGPSGLDSEEIKAQRVAEIDVRLTAIDIASVRALRAAAAGSATEADRDQLAALEAEAAALRSERDGLTSVPPDA